MGRRGAAALPNDAEEIDEIQGALILHLDGVRDGEELAAVEDVRLVQQRPPSRVFAS
jgi:hypothetical protein